MDIYMEQVPESISYSDYPSGTQFVLDDSKPERDPITFRILHKNRPLVWPEDIVKAKAEGKPEDYFLHL